MYRPNPSERPALLVLTSPEPAGQSIPPERAAPWSCFSPGVKGGLISLVVLLSFSVIALYSASFEPSS